jgi:hypothetical protein
MIGNMLYVIGVEKAILDKLWFLLSVFGQERTPLLAGNGPILVSKLTGTVEVAGTALPIEISIRDFETDATKSA